MFPYLTLPVLGGQLSAYRVMFALGVATSLILGVVLARRWAGVAPRIALRAGAWLGLAGFVGGRLHYLVNYPDTAADVWRALSPWPTGLHAVGAWTAVALALPFVGRRYGIPFRAYADTVAPVTCLALTFIRVGCFLHGCCYGRECHLAWCPTFPGHAHSAHPLQLYFAGTALGLFILGLWLLPRRRYPGQVALVVLLGFALSSLGLEFLRADLPTRVYWGPLPQLTWAALALSLLAAVILLRARSYGSGDPAPTR